MCDVREEGGGEGAVETAALPHPPHTQKASPRGCCGHPGGEYHHGPRGLGWPQGWQRPRLGWPFPTICPVSSNGSCFHRAVTEGHLRGHHQGCTCSGQPGSSCLFWALGNLAVPFTRMSQGWTACPKVWSLRWRRSLNKTWDWNPVRRCPLTSGMMPAAQGLEVAEHAGPGRHHSSEGVSPGTWATDRRDRNHVKTSRLKSISIRHSLNVAALFRFCVLDVNWC